MTIFTGNDRIAAIPKRIRFFGYRGSWVWHRPKDCVFIKVQMVGGGGGGSGYVESGGSGGYSERYLNVRGITAVNLTVGSSGSGAYYHSNAPNTTGTGGMPGGNGGTSSFGSYLSAYGGYGANVNHRHSGGRGGYGASGHLISYGGGGTGHVNYSGSGAIGKGGDSYFGGSSGDRRAHSGQKVGIGAPGTGGPGARGQINWKGADGCDGSIIITEYFAPNDDRRILELDATNPESYPGTGSVWYDLGPEKNNFNIVSTAYKQTEGGYMDFKGSHGIAKRADYTNILLEGDITYVAITRILDDNTNYRTLTSSSITDLHVQVNTSYNIGMYKASGGFTGTGYLQTSLPGYSTFSFDVIIIRWSYHTIYPDYFEIWVNGEYKGNVQRNYTEGFRSIGGYSPTSDPSLLNSNYWGDIKYFAVYGRRFDDNEIRAKTVELQRNYL